MFLSTKKEKAKQKPKACQMFRHIFDGKFYSICQTGLKIRITYEVDDDDDDDDDDGFEGGKLCKSTCKYAKKGKYLCDELCI